MPFTPMTRPEFVRIEAGAFEMGADQAPHIEDGEGPSRKVHLPAYLIGACTVSNAQFADFVQATGYLTTAEIRGSSHAFHLHLPQPGDHPAPLSDAPWWRDVQGANWRAPNGSDQARPHHPVTHISISDAQAYCAWRGVRLPTEAEWECAAQGSDTGAINIWQGEFPDAPIGVPEPLAVDNAIPNANGLYHACGNVWEWTQDGFGRLHSPRDAHNPSGSLGAMNKVVKGGSYLCAPSYCARFRPSSRRPESPAATTDHLGFRIAATLPSMNAVKT